MSTLLLGGQERRLTYPWGSMRRLEEAGVNLLQLDKVDVLAPSTLAKLVWGGLLADEPKLTVGQVEEWLSLDQLGPLTKWVADGILEARGIRPEEQAQSPTTPPAESR